ncbi:MAG TPA: methylated-DNA--[protein]-cysteine S-methyltransferase [Syntrophomonadaceae bacterium]|nr:methylated-DNA--[protein]-cysteine S-methyltransferase [Syntrophomonadaceae bacterium]
MIYFKETSLGKIGMEEKAGYIIRLYFQTATAPRNIELGETHLIREAFEQLELYLQGQLKEFSLPLMPEGTPFMKSVWHKLCQVPYGQTASYKDIATAVGNPKAVRAVGQANNKNPIPIFIPCHRIIGSRGDLVGYGGGLELKRKLLELESKLWREGNV